MNNAQTGYYDYKPVLFATLNRKLQRCWNYDDIPGKNESLCYYFYHLQTNQLKWFNRRSQQRRSQRRACGHYLRIYHWILIDRVRSEQL